MALSTAEPGLPDRVTEGQSERGREKSLKRVSVVPGGGQSDAISLPPPSPTWRLLFVTSEDR